MPITREKTDLDKKWTWLLFLGANVVVLLGCAITWILLSKSETVDLTLLYLPTLICNLVALILAGVFVYLEFKDIGPKSMHYQKKWLYFYFAALLVFIFSILFNVLYFLLFLSKLDASYLHDHLLGWELWVYIGITMFLTLVAIGLQRYARFRIDLDVYRRKHGENPNEKDDKNQPKNGEKIEAKNNEKITPKIDEKSDKKVPKKEGASGGLLDQME